jgi:hypothetical protein
MLPSLEWEVAVFSPIIHPAAHFAPSQIGEFAHGRVVGPHSVGDDCLGSAMALQDLLQQCQSSGFIPLFCDVALENFTFMVDRAPKVMLLPRSNNRSSTLRSDSGNGPYIITARRMISGEELK